MRLKYGWTQSETNGGMMMFNNTEDLLKQIAIGKESVLVTIQVDF